MRIRAARLLCLPILAAIAPADAAEPLSGSGVDLANFAFASQLGSGIYTLNGRTLQIYRLPLSWRVREATADRPGLRLTAPVTAGLIDFKPRDVVDTGLPDNLDTASLALGVELEFPVSMHWSVLPYIEAGRAFDLGGPADAYVYAAALDAVGRYPGPGTDRRLQFGTTWAAVDVDGGGSGDMLSLHAAFELLRDTGFEVGERRLQFGGYALVEWYVDRPDEPVTRSASAAAGEPLQAEVGLSFALRPMPRLWGLPLPRVGLGWRFGRDLSAFRLVLGAPF